MGMQPETTPKLEEGFRGSPNLGKLSTPRRWQGVEGGGGADMNPNPSPSVPPTAVPPPLARMNFLIALKKSLA